MVMKYIFNVQRERSYKYIVQIFLAFPYCYFVSQGDPGLPETSWGTVTINNLVQVDLDMSLAVATVRKWTNELRREHSAGRIRMLLYSL